MNALSPCEGPIEFIFKFIWNSLAVLWFVKKNSVKYPIVQRSASEVQISLDVGNLSTVDKSDLLTVRSVPVEEPPLAASDEVADSAYGDLIFSLAASDTEAEIGKENH